MFSRFFKIRDSYSLWKSSKRLRNVFGHLRMLSDPMKNLGTLKIKNVYAYKCKKVGRCTSALKFFCTCSLCKSK